jgi:hypothetical protein
MYGDSAPIIVYGWYETSDSHMIHETWLSKYYPEIEIYATEVVRMYAVRILYGVECVIDRHGNVSIPPIKTIIDEAYETITAQTEEKIYSPLGIHLGITGGFEWCQSQYIPGIGKVSNDYIVHRDSDEFEISDEMEDSPSNRSSSYLSQDD